MPTVLITPETMRDKSLPHVDMLHEAGFTIRYPENRQLALGLCSEQETIEELRSAAAVIAVGERYTERVLSALPELRVIARSGVGYDRVDVAAATARRIAVTITPTANHEAVAEHALALLFAVAKAIVAGDKRLRAGLWRRAPLRPLREKTLGILGLGRIGRSLAVRAAALRMKVIAAEIQPDVPFAAAHHIELVDFPTLLARSDYLSIHCPLTDQTRGMFNRQAFARMKPTAVLINTARGGLVVQADLVEALRSGKLQAAGLDVFEEEPIAPHDPLLELDNVVLSPHAAGNDLLSMQNMGIEAAGCIIKLYRGQWPQGAVVNDQLKDQWKW